MKQNRITQLDLHDVPEVYHNFKYNDGEILFADNITSIPGMMKQFQVNFIAYVMVLEGTMSIELNAVPFLVKRRLPLPDLYHQHRHGFLVHQQEPDAVGDAYPHSSRHRDGAGRGGPDGPLL